MIDHEFSYNPWDPFNKHQIYASALAFALQGAEDAFKGQGIWLTEGAGQSLIAAFSLELEHRSGKGDALGETSVLFSVNGHVLRLQKRRRSYILYNSE